MCSFVLLFNFCSFPLCSIAIRTLNKRGFPNLNIFASSGRSQHYSLRSASCIRRDHKHYKNRFAINTSLKLLSLKWWKKFHFKVSQLFKEWTGFLKWKNELFTSIKPLRSATQSSTCLDDSLPVEYKIIKITIILSHYFVWRLFLWSCVTCMNLETFCNGIDSNGNAFKFIPVIRLIGEESIQGWHIGKRTCK